MRGDHGKRLALSPMKILSIEFSRKSHRPNHRPILRAEIATESINTEGSYHDNYL